MNFQRSNTKISLLEDYYSHFDEDHRLQTKHGYVEYVTNMKYIHDVLNGDKGMKILDVGAATGAYSIPLKEEGYDVTAIELVEHNIEVFRAKESGVPVHQGDARDLSLFDDDSFDVVLLFGPIYHLLKEEDKLQVLKEAKRVVKNGGYILTSYYMNDYAILTYGFFKKNIVEAKEKHQFDQDFHMLSIDGDLYSMVRIEDINRFNEVMNFKRVKIIASDGAANYMRTKLRELSDEEYELFIEYHLSTCERPDLLGASSHLLDIVRVTK